MSCPVCFGGDDPVVRESLTAGIGVLLGVTAVVLGCFARFFLSLARRSRRFAHLVGTEQGARFEAGASRLAADGSRLPAGAERAFDR